MLVYPQLVSHPRVLKVNDGDVPSVCQRLICHFGVQEAAHFITIPVHGVVEWSTIAFPQATLGDLADGVGILVGESGGIG